MINIGISASGVSINDYQKQKKISALHPIDLSFCDQRSESLTGASTEYKPTKHDKFYTLWIYLSMLLYTSVLAPISDSDLWSQKLKSIG